MIERSEGEKISTEKKGEVGFSVEVKLEEETDKDEAARIIKEVRRVRLQKQGGDQPTENFKTIDLTAGIRMKPQGNELPGNPPIPPRREHEFNFNYLLEVVVDLPSHGDWKIVDLLDEEGQSVGRVVRSESIQKVG